MVLVGKQVCLEVGLLFRGGEAEVLVSKVRFAQNGVRLAFVAL